MNEKKPSFDDFLKDSENQAEFDKRIAKALETSRTKWEKETENKLKEAEKLAKMNAEEKAEHERQKKAKELEDRELALNKKELVLGAKEILQDKGLPLELVDMLDYKDAESCNKSIASLETAFNNAVEMEVKERLKGESPRGGQPNSEETDPFILGFERG